jgi:hypothetical protein
MIEDDLAGVTFVYFLPIPHFSLEAQSWFPNLGASVANNAIVALSLAAIRQPQLGLTGELRL